MKVRPQIGHVFEGRSLGFAIFGIVVVSFERAVEVRPLAGGNYDGSIAKTQPNKAAMSRLSGVDRRASGVNLAVRDDKSTYPVPMRNSENRAMNRKPWSRQSWCARLVSSRRERFGIEQCRTQSHETVRMEDV